MGIQICKNEEPCHFRNGDDKEIAKKIHWQNYGDGDSSLLKWKAPLFFKGRLWRNNENTLSKFKNLLQNHWANIKPTWHKSSLGEGKLRFLQLRTIQFSFQNKKGFVFPLNEYNDSFFAKYVYWLELFLMWAMWPMDLWFMHGLFLYALCVCYEIWKSNRAT